jgi:hypothetical protein
MLADAFESPLGQCGMPLQAAVDRASAMLAAMVNLLIMHLLLSYK